MFEKNIDSLLDVLLIFTPPYVYTEFQPGIAAINGYAKCAGLKTKIIDANIDGLEYVLSHSNKDETLNDFNKSRLNWAISRLTDKRYYLTNNFETFKLAKDMIEKLSLQTSKKNAEEFQLRRNTVAYIPMYDAQSRKGIIEALNNEKENLFYDYFSKKLIPELNELKKQTNFKVVGIAITDRKQTIPGFLISKLIKENVSDVKTVLGGNYISRNREIFSKDDELNRQLFRYVDFMQILEADKSFSQLVKEIISESQITSEKTIWLKNNKIKFNPSSEYINIDEMPAPDFEGLKAWVPEPVISYNFQRGCNYGKCGFCGLMDGYDTFSNRSQKNPSIFQPRHKKYELILNDFKKFKEKGYKYINLTDETFFARDQKIISDLILENKLNFAWTSYDRVEDSFLDDDLIKIISAGGSSFKQFGVESASVNSLNSMDKGADNVNVYKILKNTHEAGIMNHVFLLIGYPGETIQEALTLFPFLEKTKDYIFTVKPTWYKLSRGSPDSFKPEIKGIKRLYTEGDLAPNLHFETTKGMSKGAAQAVNDLLQGWINRYHVINYVAGTYCYSQRFFAGYEEILKTVDKINSGFIKRPDPFNPHASLSNREKRALSYVWRELVGSEFSKISKKYDAGNRNSQLMKAYELHREQNLIAKNYPNGFSSINDLINISKKIIKCDKK
ncbi:radical SAM protein [Candidatus Woesearchaeota archaeon]|nr:radical SAM protein [Candidatus Woesearchaeota archaeon]